MTIDTRMLNLIPGFLGQRIGRRDLVKGSILGTSAVFGSGMLGGLIPDGYAKPRTNDVKETHDVKEVIAVTTSGRVRGFKGLATNGVEVFRSIPYGAPTGGDNRFMPPRKPEPWTGVRDAFENGHMAPQNTSNGNSDSDEYQWRTSTLQGEDCLVLNVYTPGIGAGNRPVMVWLHGGGYIRGTGTAPGYDGTNLAGSRDVVVVAVNHRLNLFGYLYLAEAGGDKFADSGNVGMLDLIAALEWVRDNISHFGGNPGNVTIFGQSGGGGKVSTLFAMPAAKGLFHKGIVESGSTLRQLSREDAQKTTEVLLAKLNLHAGQIDQLQKLPANELLAAFMALENGLRLAPVVDGRALSRDPFNPTAPDISADVPMMIGTVETEGSLTAGPELLTLNEAGMRTELQKRFGDKTDRLVQMFRKTRPNATPAELYFIITAFPTTAITQAERKAALRKAPAYMYLFTWRAPVEDGRRLSGHTFELPFVFNNVLLCSYIVGNGPQLQPLADKVSSAWAAFARTGDPSAPGLPRWPAYNTTERATMIINNEWKVVNDPSAEERVAMADIVRPAF